MRSIVRDLGGTPRIRNLPEAPVQTADIGDNQVSNAKLADMATATIKGRITAGTGDPEDLTPAQARTVISVRELLTANRTYYVRTDGSDSNDGLANTAGGAFLTIQKAIDVAVALDLSIYSVTINVAAGTYTGAVVLKNYIGVGPITINGDTTTPSNCFVDVTSNTCFSGAPLRRWDLKGFKTRTTTSGWHIRPEGSGSVVYVGAWEFGTAPSGYAHMNPISGAVINYAGNHTISGGITNGRHYYASGPGSQILAPGSFTVTLTGSPGFGTFAIADRQGTLDLSGITYSGGAAAGTQRFFVGNLGFIYRNVAEASSFPGNVAGSGTNPGVSPWGLYA